MRFVRPPRNRWRYDACPSVLLRFAFWRQRTAWRSYLEVEAVRQQCLDEWRRRSGKIALSPLHWLLHRADD